MTDDVNPSLMDRTLWHLRRRWRDIAASARVAMTGAVRPNLPDDDVARLMRRIVVWLEGRGGEVSARARGSSGSIGSQTPRTGGSSDPRV